MSESIDVEIRLVPFYAVDEDGKPVFDLKQDEIELRLDGKPVAVDTFDAFVREETAPAAGEKKAPRNKMLAEIAKLKPDIGQITPESGSRSADQIAMELPGKAAYVWGIGAVEPATGRAWFRRFQLQGKP